MLKFSGYSYLIRGQPLKRCPIPGGGEARFMAVDRCVHTSEIENYYAQSTEDSATGFEELRFSAVSQH
ncbi:hypothetical protein DD571_32130 [Klebsiella pneumoniae]|nr:hypothetical protein DD571_32130 [Klebsiella pneumoniae]